jgi:hypothetical protein
MKKAWQRQTQRTCILEPQSRAHPLSEAAHPLDRSLNPSRILIGFVTVLFAKLPNTLSHERRTRRGIGERAGSDEGFSDSRLPHELLEKCSVQINEQLKLSCEVRDNLLN